MDSCPFPLEVVDLIVDQLSFDVSALKTSIFVCRAWVPSCRTHLFRRLRLGPTGKCSPENWDQFLSDSPHIISYIHELCILCDRSSWVSWDAILPTFLTKLLHLQQIELSGCDLPFLPAALTSTLYTLFRLPSMKHVSLRLCVFPSYGFDLFGPALESISLSDVVVEPDVCVAALDKQNRTARPKQLLLEGKNIAAVIDWLLPSLETSELEDLQHLCVRYCGGDDETLHAIERLLQSASSLKTLELCLFPTCFQAIPKVGAAPSICYNRKLREVRVSHFDADLSSPTNQLPWLVSLLSQLTSQHMIQNIYIDARHRPSHAAPILDVEGWGKVDDILARSDLCDLEDVHIRIVEGSNWGAAELTSSMPKLQTRGVLKFRCT